MFKRIVVGVDEHEGGRDAIALAKHLPARDGELTLARVLSRDGHGYGSGGIEAHAAYGDAAEELALYSASLDLLAVGSRAHGPIGRLVHGSTSRKLTHLARCPLLVLPRPARVIEAGEAGEAGREPAIAAKG